jgi:septal ring factor EnvC (AmiA/AmiB activator)
MKFKGVTYSSILDLETLLIVWEANLQALKIEFKYYSVAREIKNMQETQIKINAYEKGIKELKEHEESLIEKINALNEEMNDIQGKVFILKFIKGKSNDEIMEELHMCKTSLFTYYEKIDALLENTIYGKDIKDTLRDE